MKRTLIACCVIACISCNTGEDKKPKQGMLQQTGDSLPANNKVDTIKTVARPDANMNVQDKNSIHLSFADGSDSVSVTGKLDSLYSSVSCIFSITGKKKLTARIETAKRSTNIRFNQIILPGKKADGPFGKEIEYDLPEKGIYTLIIGHSLMAENPYAGSFRLHVTLR